MTKYTMLPALICLFLLSFSPAWGAETPPDPSFGAFIDTVFEKNDLEMAVKILIQDSHIPISDVIKKAMKAGYGFTRIIDALIDAGLPCEQVMIEALQNGAPPTALFDSKKISDDNDYKPDKILKFLVKQLEFMERTEAEQGKKDYNSKTREANSDIILRVCKSMMDDKDFSQFDVVTLLCEAEASDQLLAEVADRFDVPPAVTFKACPRHAQFGHAYISHDLPQKAYIVIGVDHQTLDDNAGLGNGVISPKSP